MTSTAAEISNNATYTAQAKAASTTKVTGAAQTLGSQDFLNLMMQQLQYQDPMAPQSNSEFIAQTAQFSQLSTAQEMNKSITTNNSIMQTLTLVGKEVTLTDPTNTSKTITGNVTEAKFTSDGAAIVVGGKAYPISLVQSVKEPTTAGTGTTTGTTDTTKKTS